MAPEFENPVLVAGAGYVGQALIALLREQGTPVYSVKRNPGPPRFGEHALALDLSDSASLLQLPADIRSIVYLLSPDGPNPAAYAAAYLDGLSNLLASEVVSKGPVERILFASSTAVYGQTDGSWVDESSRTEPTRFSGRCLLQAEQLLESSGVSHSIVRFAGIYGPGRQRLLSQVLEGRAVFGQEPLITNRIHRDDCAGFLKHLLESPSPARLYVGVDDEPAPLKSVLEWLAERTSRPPPVLDLTARPGRGGNKRCSNRRLRASGYRLKYPSFREGYGALLPSGR